LPKFAANLSMLFTEVPFAERFERAAQAGFTLVECQFPYELPAEQIKSLLDDLGLTMVLHNLPAGDWAAGDRGIACDPARVDEFRAGVVQAISYATTLGVKKINCLAGKLPDGVSEQKARQTLIDNLRHASTALARHDIQLLIEPINRYDIPGFFRYSTTSTMRSVWRVNSLAPCKIISPASAISKSPIIRGGMSLGRVRLTFPFCSLGLTKPATRV
jgi:hydroxypyruvate isomerase